MTDAKTDIAPIATASTAASNTTTSLPPESTPYASMLPLLLIFVVFYFLLIRPQQKKIREHNDMLKELKRGDKVVTSGGIIGSVFKIESDDTITIEIASEVRVRVMKDGISQVFGDEDKAKPKSKKSDNDN